MNQKGVSAVIGVILMVAITVVIAYTVYVYVSGLLYPYDNDSFFSGQIIDKFKGNYLDTIYYFFTVENISLNKIIDINVNSSTYYSYQIGNYYTIYNLRG